MDELDWTEKELLKRALNHYYIFSADSDEERDEIDELVKKLEL